jgi:hypothetical protein
MSASPPGLFVWAAATSDGASSVTAELLPLP